ncbi:DUF2388 domain-containing protein [Lysobacter sp. S4-A87]|uniref:DUF2388 domain-containing protein n=1 Tax=Lysobacter sp. S4-A87 TaxID=2925843 RepID=UPI001F52D365|nr:DUF2388 domain-containing protein [Lysobacter sp. S4-A87]UNK49495.1 DUF2388 domain-containing protein [Lysobacter sp. S4-A87]
MKSPAVLLSIALLGATPAAFASSFAGTSAGGSSASSASSDSSSGNDKVVLAARDDAASFVASDGAIRGAQLEAALRHLRENVPQARQASDIELAKAILAL